MRTFFPSLPLVLSLLLFATVAPAQVKPDATPDRYAAESFVVNNDDWVYSNNADGTGYRERTIAISVKTEAAVRVFGVVGVSFASASEHVEFHYARVRHKDGSVTETPIKDVMEQPEEVTREAPFYSDLKQAQLPIKNLQAGDTLEWQARIVRTRAEAPNQFWGEDSFFSETDGVALEESFELRVPTASAPTVWTNPRLGAKPVETVDGATKVYRWTSSQLNPLAGAEAEAAKKAKKGKLLTAEEELDVEDGKLPSVAWTTFKSWDAVGAWYRGLEGTRTQPDDEIKAKVKDLTEGKTTEEEKVRAVYAYVSSQIRYIGVAFGIGRFQPHEAADVLHNQYGDCKDKATLLAAMLGALGLHADSVLIGAGVRLNEAVPSPSAFNHLITRVKVGNEEVWLDATAEVAPYKVLLFGLRDKQALVVPEQGVASLEHTPKDLPFPALDAWKAVGSLDKDGVSESHISMTLRGDDEVEIRAVTHQVSPGRYDELVQNFVKAIGYGGTISHADVSRPEDTVDPFSFSFDYHREQGGDWKNLKIVAQLPPVQLPMVDEKDPPEQSLNLGTARTEVSSAAMKLPAGWGVELPEAVHEKTAWATYDLTYRFDQGTVYADRRLVILQRKVPASDWKAYKKWTDAINLGYESFIQLKRVDGKQDGVATQARPSNSDASTQAILEQLDEAYKRKDLKAMEDLLKKMKSIDPKARRLLAWQAALAGLRGKYDETIADNRKELALYPDELDRYEAILWAQRRKNDKGGAEVTLRHWADAAPQDPKPMMALAVLLTADNKMEEAVATANGAVQRTSADTEDGTRARLLLGETQLKAGQADAGKTTLVALLKFTEDPGLVNDAAYELADAKLELPLDETSERAAIEKLTTETSSWTLDENPDSLKAKTALLEASWDTMGWILFREGKFSEAKSWLVAAGHTLGRDVVKKHLAQEWTALSNAAPAGTTIEGPGTAKSDQQLRTIPLGPSGGRVGTAEYRLLLSHGRVERAESAGDEKLNGAETLLKNGDFSQFFPTGSNAKLVRSGFVNCVAGKCEVVLEE